MVAEGDNPRTRANYLGPSPGRGGRARLLPDPAPLILAQIPLGHCLAAFCFISRVRARICWVCGSDGI
jgi:hypothetical protein